MIRLDGVTKQYPDGTIAVDDLSLTAPDGAITVLVGPSGCGKTTTLRMINRMVEPTSGTVTIDGRDVRAYDRGFGPVDVVLSPVLTHTTPKIGYLGADLDFATHFERVSGYVGFTPLHNAAGAPSISLPLGRTPDGRPVGVMVSARRGQERVLLELAHELEAARPFARVGGHTHG